VGDHTQGLIFHPTNGTTFIGDSPPQAGINPNEVAKLGYTKSLHK